MHLLIVKLNLAGEEVEPVMHTGASVSVVGKRLAWKLGIWKTTSKVKVRQRDRSTLGGNFGMNIKIKVMDSSSVVGKFRIDANILDIRNRDLILELS